MSAELKAAAAQPAPTGNGPEVLPVVLQFLTQRQEQGARKYGTTLRAHNGRSALRDAKEEAADQLMYLTQLEMEWPAIVAQVRADALDEALRVVEVHLAPEETAAAPGSEPARAAALINDALRKVYAALRGLQGKPPAEPDPVRTGPRKGQPRKQRKGHRWRRKSITASKEARAWWACADCPLERHDERGPRGGCVEVFTVDGREVARGNLANVRVPSCPPAPKGAP